MRLFEIPFHVQTCCSHFVELIFAKTCWSCIHVMYFSFFTTLSRSILKSTSTAQAQLPVFYVSIFQKLVKFCYKIKQPAPPSPVFVHAKLLKSYKKDQIFHCFALWFGLLSFQHCCATVLRKISLASLNQPSTESFEE